MITKIVRLLAKVGITIVTILAGNWIGSQLRSLVTGREEPGLEYRFVGADGTNYANVPVMTKFYPALLVTWFGRFRWPTGLMAGVLTGALVSEELERRFASWLLPQIVARVRRVGPGR